MSTEGSGPHGLQGERQEIPYQEAQHQEVERREDDFIVDASLVGELLNVPPIEVPALIRDKRITSVCERGTDADHGMFRLNLFYRGRHARLRVDPAGRVLHRSVIDFGDRPPAGSRAAIRSAP